MISLKSGCYRNIEIRPRWPAKEVMIESRVLSRLCDIQEILPQTVSLILTRGYEKQATHLGLIRRVFRCFGVMVFCCLYPHRIGEMKAIFGANGHDVDGSHIDISYRFDGKRIYLLPLSVFTPLWLQKRLIKRVLPSAHLLKQMLIEHGFQIHDNETESAQIHCDFIR